MIFSTSAGPIVFNSYKDKPPLPEDVARANGHTYLAQYLQDVNTRLSKEVGSEAQSNAIDWLELVKSVQTQASAVQVKSVKEEKHPSESDDNSSDYFADSETSSNGSLGLDEANQPDSDSDSSIDKELCNITGWYNEEPSKSPATRARQEGPSCKTPEVEKPPNREDSGATLLDNKDRTPFEKEKPAADSMEEKDYAVGRGFINSLSQWFSTTRKKRKDETKSATIRRFNGATFFWGPFDKGDTSGQANVHSAENPQECAGKGHLSSQRRTAPDFKYSRITVTCVVLVVLVVLLVLAGIMQGIEFTVHHLIAIVYGVTTGLLTEVTMGDCVLVFKFAVVALLFLELINTGKKKMNEKDCSIVGLCHEEPNQRPATCACKEGPCCETPGVEKPPNWEDSGATRLDNKDRTAFEKEKPAADSNEEKDYAVGWGFIDSRPQLLSYTREKREDEKCADKDHMSSQRRTGPDLKYILVMIICLVDAVLVGNMLIVCDVGLVFSKSDFSLLKFPPGDPQNCSLADRPRLEVLPGAGSDNLRNEHVELGFPRNYSGYKMLDAGQFIPDNMFLYHVEIGNVIRFAEFCDHSNDNSSVTTQNINAEDPAAFQNCNTGESFVSESHSVKKNQGQDNSVTLLLFSRRFDGHFSAIIMVNQKLDECTNNIVHSTPCTVGELLVNLTFPLSHLLENQMLDELVAVDLSRGTRDVLKRAIKQFYQRNTIDALNFRFPAIFYYGSGEKPRYSNMFGSVCQTCQFDGDPVDDPYELLLLKYSEFWDLVVDRGRPPGNNHYHCYNHCYNHYQRIFSNTFQRLFLFLLVMFVTIFIAICCVVRLVGVFATPIYCLQHLCGKPCKEDLQANEHSYGYEDLEIGHQMKDTTCRGSICGLSAQGKSLGTGINIFHQYTVFRPVYGQFVENASKEELQMERLRSWLVDYLYEEPLPLDLNSGVEERLSQLEPSLSRVLTFDGGSRTKTIFYDHAHTELSPYNNFITCLRLLLTLALSTDDDKKGKASIPRVLGSIEKELEFLACLIDILRVEEVPIDYERVARRYGFSIRSRNSKPLGKTGKQRQDREIMKELVKLWKTLVRALERLEVGTQVMREEVDHEAVVKSFNLFLLWKWKNAALEEGLHSSVNSSSK